MRLDLITYTLPLIAHMSLTKAPDAIQILGGKAMIATTWAYYFTKQKAIEACMAGKANATNVDIGKASQAAGYWIKEHPYQSAIHAVSLATWVAPGAAVASVLGAAGFGSEGIVTGTLVDELPLASTNELIMYALGTLAARLHSVAGPLVARGPVAYLQSAGMSGYGLQAAKTAVQAAVGLGEGVFWGNKLVGTKDVESKQIEKGKEADGGKEDGVEAEMTVADGELKGEGFIGRPKL